MSVEYGVFVRLCSRSREIVLEEGAPSVLVQIYQTAIRQPMEAFCTAMQTVKRAEKRLNDAEEAKESMLTEMDGLFRMARSAVAAIEPTTVLPDTLKAQPTDTDKREAIQDLLSTLQEHAGATWADSLLEGAFGQKAPAAMQQLNECIEAANALQKAKSARASIFEPAWSAFVKYKRLVRDTLGSSSRQYQRLRVRSISMDDSEDEDKVGVETQAKLETPKKPEAKVQAAVKEKVKAEANKNVTDAPESAAVPSGY